MKEAMENLRMKPEATRRNILHGIIFVLGILLVILWVVTLNRNIKDDTTQEEIAQDVNAFSSLSEDLSEGYQEIIE